MLVTMKSKNPSSWLRRSHRSAGGPCRAPIDRHDLHKSEHRTAVICRLDESTPTAAQDPGLKPSPGERGAVGREPQQFLCDAPSDELGAEPHAAAWPTSAATAPPSEAAPIASSKCGGRRGGSG